MKKFLTPTLTLILAIGLAACSTQKAANSSKDIKTATFTIDLAGPGSGSVITDVPRTSLQAHTKDPISFKLINGNPFKYKYVINSNAVNLFENTADPFAEQLKKIEDAKKAAEKTDEAKATTVPEEIAAANKKIAQLEKQIADLTAAKAAVSKSSGKKNNSNSKVVEGLSKQITKLQADLTSDRSDLAATKQRVKENYRQATDYINTTIYNDTLFAESVRRLKIASVVSTGDEKNSKDAFIANARIMLQTTTEVLYDINAYKLFVVNEDFLDTNYTNHKKEFSYQLLQLTRKFGDLNNSIQNANINDTKLDAIVKKIDGNLGEIKATYATLANVQMNYYTLPHDVNGKNIDLLKMTVERRDKVTNALLSKNDYQIWMRGGFKIDISAGIF